MQIVDRATTIKTCLNSGNFPVTGGESEEKRWL